MVIAVRPAVHETQPPVVGRGALQDDERLAARLGDGQRRRHERGADTTTLDGGCHGERRQAQHAVPGLAVRSVT